MAISFGDLSTAAGLKELDAHLLTRSYISGYQASRDDLTVYAALAKFPTGHTNVERWYKHIKGLLGSSFPGAGVGVSIGGAVSSSGGAAGAAEPVAPPKAESKPAADEDDDDDLDLFGEATEEEKAAAAEREAKAKASGKQKEAGKSSVLLDVKPWDDETDMAKLEAAVRAVQMDGLTWGASKLVPVGYGIKKMTIMMTIVDDLVSIDALVEDHLTQGDCAEYVQSCDIVAFNKI